MPRIFFISHLRLRPSPIAHSQASDFRPVKTILRQPSLQKARQFRSTTAMSKRALDSERQAVPAKPIPSNYEFVTFAEEEYTAVQEGLASILFRQPAQNGADQTKKTDDVTLPDSVFYNPIQQFNRDLSVLAIKTFGDLYVSERTKKSQRSATSVPTNSLGPSTEIATAEASPQEHRPEESSRTNRKVKFSILDALSATGLRALRYSLEIPYATSITANDLDAGAVKAIKQNIEYNGERAQTIDPDNLTPAAAMAKIRVNEGNARNHMYGILAGPGSGNGPSADRHKYEVIDLDPYGSAAPFLDAAVQAVSNGGLLCITCTDPGVWASVGYSEKCFSLYGGLPVKGEWCHEAGLRLILHATATSAARYGLSIEPLLSLSIDYYARVFVRVRKSPMEVKNLASSTMTVYNCDEGCGSWYEQRLGKAKEVTGKSGKSTYMKYGLARAPSIGHNCPECDSPMHLAGPMWGGQLHSLEFIQRFSEMLPTQPTETYQTIPRITGMLETAALEAELNDYPFFHVTDRLSRALHCEAPPLAGVRGALIGLGYKVARSHCKPVSIKTNAPHSVVWDVMKKWMDSLPKKGEGLKSGMAGFKIVEDRKDKDLSNIVLDQTLGRDTAFSAGAVRYQLNPTANWGPMGRAKTKNHQPNASPSTRASKKPRIADKTSNPLAEGTE